MEGKGLCSRARGQTSSPALTEEVRQDVLRLYSGYKTGEGFVLVHSGQEGSGYRLCFSQQPGTYLNLGRGEGGC